ncbi:hypothetical protein FP744_10000828 [Trichoderma asperellum]|nr:hypothetical protein LI328DRAFT_95443 [Trichoderma asperelloides]
MDTLQELSVGRLLETLASHPLTALGAAVLFLSMVYTLMPSSRRNVPLCNSPRPEKQSKDALTIDPLNDLDWKAVEPTKYRPFKPIYHITMALKADTPSELITVDTDYFDRVSLRRQIISQHGALVHGCLPAGVEAVNELYQFLLKDYLPTRFPTMFQLRDQGRRFENLVTGQTFPTAVPEDPAAALRALSETVEEDMFLLIGEPEGHRAVAFQCCFPSGFDPSSKVGKLLREIHSPVPSYDKIGPSMERFFSKIEVGKNVKRTNWGIQTDGNLFHYERHDGPTSDAPLAAEAETDMSQTYARIELQTLSRLPKTRAVLFSFKTYLYSLRQLGEEGLGPQVADAIEGLKTGNAPGMWNYKGAPQWGEPVCRYLRS